VAQTDRHRSLENQVKFTELLKSFHHRLIGDENTAIKLGHEEGEELISALKALLVLEKMLEILNHGVEKLNDELVAESGFQLIQIVISIDKLLVVVQEGLLDVDLDLLVEDLGETLG
jgi:hypothetical protein